MLLHISPSRVGARRTGAMRAGSAPAERCSAAANSHPARSASHQQPSQTTPPKSDQQQNIRHATPKAQPTTSTSPKTQSENPQRRPPGVKQETSAPETSNQRRTDQPAYRTRCLHRRRRGGREQNSSPDPDPEEARRRRRRRRRSFIHIRVLSLFIQWVLLSTETLCAFTHINAVPAMLTPTILPLKNYTTLPSQSSHQSPPHSPTPPQARSTPHAAQPPTPPTQHQQQHTRVSIKFCTYHKTQKHPSNTLKHHSTQFTSLPPKYRSRLSPPAASARQIHIRKPYRTYPTYAPHTPKTSRRQLQPHSAPMRHQDTGQNQLITNTRHTQTATPHTDLPHTDPQSPKRHPRNNPLTKTHPPPTEIVPPHTKHHNAYNKFQRTHPLPNQTHALPLPTSCHTSVRNPKPDFPNAEYCHHKAHTLPHHLTPKTVTLSDNHTPIAALPHTESRHPNIHTTQLLHTSKTNTPPAVHTQIPTPPTAESRQQKVCPMQHHSTPETATPSLNHSKTLHYHSLNRHSHLQTLTALPTKTICQPRTLPTDTTCAPPHRNSQDRRSPPDPPQLLQIPPECSSLLTQSPTIPPHSTHFSQSSHTAMASNGDPHTGVHYTRSNPSLSHEGRNKTKGTASSAGTGHQVRSQGRTTPNIGSRARDEEAISLAGVGPGAAAEDADGPS